MKIRTLACVGVFCFLALSAGGCVSSKPQGYSGVTSYAGILYLGSMDGKIVAVNPSARSQELPFPSSNGEWSYPITTLSKSMLSCSSSPTPVSIYGTPVVVDGSVCVGTYSGKVLMINPSARSQNLSFPHMRGGEWIYPRTDDVIGAIVGSPVAESDTIYVCSSDGRVYALDATYGDEKWKSDTLGDKLWSTPVVTGETVYVSTFDGHVYALSAEDGSLLPWVFEAETGFVSSPVLYKDTLIVGSFDRKLYAIETDGGDLLWEFPAANWFWAAPVLDDGIAYAGCLDGRVYALNVESGEELWELDTGDFVEKKKDHIISSPILVDDSLVVATESGNVFVVNPKTGSPERVKNPDDSQSDDKPSVDAPIWSSLCALDSMVYVRAQDNYLYVVDVAEREMKLKFCLD